MITFRHYRLRLDGLFVYDVWVNETPVLYGWPGISGPEAAIDAARAKVLN
jgi:hypothetical protein